MKYSNELKIGVMVSIVFVLLGVLTVKTGEINFKKEGYLLTVRFRQVDGVGKNAPVMLNGLEVGQVKNISINEQEDETFMDLTVWLDSGARVREGAQAYVKNMGFMGEKYVGLTSGPKGHDFLSAGAVITGEEPADFDRILIDGQDIAKQVKSLVTNLNERVEVNKEMIDTIIVNLNDSMVHLASVTENVDQRLKINKENIDEALANMRSSSVNLDQFTYDLKMHPWKLLYRPKEKRAQSIEMMDKK